MKHSTVLSLFLALGLVLSGATLYAQDGDPAAAAADTMAAEAVVEALEYEDFTVKAYSISLFGGSFSGGRFLDLQEREVRTDYGTPPPPHILGPGDILGYNGLPLSVAREKLDDGITNRYDAAQKEINSGPAYGGRIGVYISDSFHLDIIGSYARSEAVTTMLQRSEDNDPAKAVRVQVDEDVDFATYRGGLSLVYDAHPARIFGLVPRLGFGIGGVINSFSELEEKTSLYLEGSFGLGARVFSTVDIIGQVDVSTFSFDVEELGYSNMVSYNTFSLGISWWIDVLPDGVRAARDAETEQR